jgi:hypothetical protein
MGFNDYREMAVPLLPSGTPLMVRGGPSRSALELDSGSTYSARLGQPAATIELCNLGLVPHATIPALGRPKLSMPEIKFS